MSYTRTMPNAIERVVQEERTAAEQRATERVAHLLANEQPDRSKLPGYGSAGRVTPATQRLYDKLPADEQKIRNPDTDADVMKWYRSLFTNREEHSRVVRELTSKYGDYERANLLEGATGTGTGGDFLPVPLANAVLLARDKETEIRRRATVHTAPGQSLKIPVCGVLAGAMAAEGAVSPDVTPNPTTVQLYKKKGQVNVQCSWEMTLDSQYNLVSFFAERAGSGLGALEDAQFATGTGAAPEASGIDAGSITAVHADVNTVVYADLVELYFGLPKPYRKNGTFFGSSTTLQYVNSIISSTGQAVLSGLLAPPQVVVDGALGSLFGRPVVEIPVDDGNFYFGDLRFYQILSDEGIYVRVNEAALWTTDEIAMRFSERFDGAVGIADAFRSLTGIDGGAWTS